MTDRDANGELEEKVYKVGGMYGESIEQVVHWLEKAITVAENDKQRRAFELLVKYYKSGDLKDFDDYSVAWVEDTDSSIDVINGFIEVYNDPIAYLYDDGEWNTFVRSGNYGSSLESSGVHAGWTGRERIKEEIWKLSGKGGWPRFVVPEDL